MSGIKSALTAALSGSPAKPAQARTAGKVDSESFPCISEGAPLSPEQAAEGLAALDINRATLPSNAPTLSRSLDASRTVVDYDLNPYNPRGGREVVPTSLKSSSIKSNFLTEAVIGSLPRGLSHSEREFIVANTPLSPSLNLLSSLPRDQVSARSVEGRTLRRHVLRGAVIVFITAGYSGKRFIFEKAKELGVRSVLIDGPDSWSQEGLGWTWMKTLLRDELETNGIVERFIGLDMTDADSVFDRALAAIEKVKKDFGELDGVVSFSEMAQPLVARLIEKLGLPGNSSAAVDSARDKHATRRCMSEAGLPTPRNFLITREDELDAASQLVGYPAVIKPIHGAASLGVVRVDDHEALLRAYARVRREMGSVRVHSGIVEQMASDDEGEGNFTTTLMMEEYLDGPEVDVDVVFSEGQAVYGAVTDNWPTLEPYFNETGSNSPSILPSAQQRELLELGVASVKALGFDMGVFHVECKYTSRGPRLIEVNCRMGGGPVRNMNLLVWGVDLVEEQLLLAAGIPSRPPVAPAPLTHLAEFSVNAQRSGVLADVSFLDKYDVMKDVLYVRPLVEAGAKVTCVEDGMPTWVCEIMVQHPTSTQAAIDYVNQIEAAIQKEMPIEARKAK
ncbi:Carnosine synthase 1 [Auxenochlorella protothecoides]|uniref:Carnosine synthase 1 n=1 Tax=Auxenochlorella protothecoides TaxID=3075 RepID=A0A087SNK4_AUXPR|nr:Carnosine synthase 1 [Auxenochlorella protothecoides]KFM27308.1 Carnosine synthase 1 [Auxenochlorella protothecoides]